MLLRRHNLNLLPILRELLHTRSVTRTADVVGLSPSGVSAALARLREVFADDLLVMVGRTLQPTKLGVTLSSQLEEVCLDLEALLAPRGFDPATSDRAFVVATADYVAFLLGPAVARILGEEAPGVTVRFCDVPPDYLTELERGQVDVLIASQAPTLHLASRTRSSEFLRDEMVVIGARHRERRSTPLDRAAYEAAAHVSFQLQPADREDYEAVSLARAGVRQRDRVTVQQFVLLPAIVAESHCLALIQRRLAERFAAMFPIEIMTPPFPIEPLTLHAHLPEAAANDPERNWLLNLLGRALARSLKGEPGTA